MHIMPRVSSDFIAKEPKETTTEHLSNKIKKISEALEGEKNSKITLSLFKDNQESN